jgi:outer membrane immunogenic protein
MVSKTKLMLLSSVLTLGGPAISLAADLPVKAPAVQMYPKVADPWTGWYLGGAFGVVSHHVSGNWGYNDFEGFFPENFSGDKTGGIYGGYLGYNWQNGSYVLGIEGDFSGISGTKVSQVGIYDTDYNITSKANWLATIRARAGFLAAPDTLLYLTGGVAFADFKTSVTVFDGTETSNSDTQTGWTLGGGVEHMFSRNWIGRLEFLYADFGHATHNYATTEGNYYSDLSHQLIIGRVGIAYKW